MSRIWFNCGHKAAAKRGNTSNMFTYISEHHPSVQIQLCPFYNLSLKPYDFRDADWIPESSHDNEFTTQMSHKTRGLMDWWINQKQNCQRMTAHSLTATCSHKTKTQAHGQKNNSPAMCKTRHEHAANEKTRKPCVHTRQDNKKARSQWNTQAACHTAQDITCTQPIKTRTACNTTKHTWTEEHAAERTRDRTLTQIDRTSEPRHETEI